MSCSSMDSSSLAMRRQPALLSSAVLFVFPSFSLWSSTPFQLLETLVLWPLELYESLAIIPVSFLRRHLPLVGGTLVVLMTLQGILLRLFLDLLHGIFARITYSRDPVFNYQTFWATMRDRYASMELRDVNWLAAHRLFGEPLRTTTNEEDLWIALQESIAMTDDPGLRVTSTGSASVVSAYGRSPLTSVRQRLEHAALDVMQQHHLTDGGRRLSNHFLYGILNAETSPGWRIGYIALTAMDGFVDFPLPRLDTLTPVWSQNAKDAMTRASSPQRLKVPEVYDLESMRWALEAILRSLGDVDGLVLDLRFNAGGGSLVSALSVASFFAGPKRSVAFMTDEKLYAQRFSRTRKHYIPLSSRTHRYNGPLVVLQGQYTRGTAELLTLALMNRPKTYRIGASTAGSLSQAQKLRLPNYWTVEIPYMRFYSAEGKLYEGRGVPATKHVPNMDEALLQPPRAEDPVMESDGEDGHDVFDPCIKAAIAQIISG